MTILEYAKKLNIQLNSMQLELLDLWEKNRDISAVIMLPRMSGRQMIYDLITSYEGYMQGRKDAIDECKNLITSMRLDNISSNGTNILDALEQLKGEQNDV